MVFFPTANNFFGPILWKLKDWSIAQESLDELGRIPPVEIIAPCFDASTPILLADGRSVGIEDIRVGTRVAAFDERDAVGAGELWAGLVTRLIPGITTEWIMLDDGTRVTPGHRYLRPDGSFMAIADILASDGRVVDAHGHVTRITGSLLRATDASSDASWIEPDPVAEGGTLKRPAPVLGWRTYNFEVAGLHTYVAAGKRVHNDCLAPGEQLLPDTLQLTANGYSIDVIDPVTGLVSTINHEYVGSPDANGGWETVILTRATYLADIDAYLTAEWGSFNDAALPIGNANWGLTWGGVPYILQQPLDGLVVQHAPAQLSQLMGNATQAYAFVDPDTGTIVQSVGVMQSPSSAESFLVTAKWDGSDSDNLAFTADMWNDAGVKVGNLVGLDDGTTIQKSGTSADSSTWNTTVTVHADLPGLTAAQEAALQLAAFNTHTLVGGQVGTIFGSALSQAPSTDNVLEQVAAGSILAAIGQNLGQVIDAGLSTTLSMTEIVDLTLADFGADLANAFKTQALGAVSGFLLGELAENAANDTLPPREAHYAA